MTHPDAIRAGLPETTDQTHINIHELKGIWIPQQYLWADDLKVNEKILMAFIHMADQKDHCYASNETLGKWVMLPTQTVKNLIVSLKKKGYLEQVSWDGRTRRVLKCLK